MDLTYSRQQLIQETALTEEDRVQIRQCRRAHNQLGFAYQVGFVRLLNRFPLQESFELIEELLAYVSAQLELPTVLIDAYSSGGRPSPSTSSGSWTISTCGGSVRPTSPSWRRLSSRKRAA